jgi:hypothetical protein
MVDVRLPASSFKGDLSQETGFFVETVLDKIQLTHGIRAPMKALETGLTLQQIAELPETVRLRILLFLKDLSPIETALGIKTEPNSFLRCRAVNKALTKLSKNLAKRKSAPPQGERRQELMAALLKMDDDMLEDLLQLYRQRSRRSHTGRPH